MPINNLNTQLNDAFVNSSMNETVKLLKEATIILNKFDGETVSVLNEFGNLNKSTKEFVKKLLEANTAKIQALDLIEDETEKQKKLKEIYQDIADSVKIRSQNELDSLTIQEQANKRREQSESDYQKKLKERQEIIDELTLAQMSGN